MSRDEITPGARPKKMLSRNEGALEDMASETYRQWAAKSTSRKRYVKMVVSAWEKRTTHVQVEERSMH